MTETTVAIIGAGLAGLNAARLLHLAGVDFRVFEARDRVGGRILSVNDLGEPVEDGFDLGPSWFWPQTQPAIRDLVAELGLPSFAQHTTGDFVFERGRGERPLRLPAMAQEATSMRLVGGTAALVRALLRDLPPAALHLATPVTALRLGPAGVEVTAGGQRFEARHVIVALPPRLWAERVALHPAPLPQDLARWKATATWMAPHAKVVALYDRPFWRVAGLSGMAQSLVGPLGEIHDATTASGKAALFGFAGLSATHRAAIGQRALIGAAVQQLTRLFGPEAAAPRATLVMDWAAQPWTATAADSTATGHPVPLSGDWVAGDWAGRLIMAGGEASPVEPGYLAGAVVASELAVAQVLRA